MLTVEQVQYFYLSLRQYGENREVEQFLQRWLESDVITYQDRQSMKIICQLSPQEFIYTGEIYRGIGKYHEEPLNLELNTYVSWTSSYQVARRFARMVEGWSLEEGDGFVICQHTDKGLNLTKLLQTIYPYCNDSLRNTINIYCSKNYEMEIIDTLKECSIQTFRVVNNDLT